MKKLLGLLVVLTLSVTSLTACSTTPAEEELDREIVILNYESTTAYQIVQKVVQDIRPYFEEYGFTIKMESVPFATKLDMATAGDYEVTFAGWGPDYDWPTTYLDMWRTTNTYNEVGYENADYDALIDPTGKDAATVWADLQAAEATLLNDAPIIPIYQRAGVSLQNPDLTGLVAHLSGYDYTFKWASKADGSAIKMLETEVIPSMDPTEATDAVSFLSLGNTMEGLVMQGPNADYINGVAESYSFDEATLTWTFNLNPNAVWVDSTGAVQRAVTAADFAYSWDRLANSTTSQYTFLLADVAKIVSYEAVDDSTFTVTVSENVPYFLSNLAFPSFYPIAEENVNDTFGTTNEGQWYNGAFYMSTRTPTNVVWTKNANYWDAANVLPPAVEFRVIEQYDVATGVELYDNGDIDRVALSGDFVTDRQNDPDAIVVPDTAVFYLMINIANGGVTEAGPTFDASAGDDVFDNAKIRQAIALIIDKAYITDSILKNGSQAAYSFVPSNYLSSEGVAFEAARGDGYLLQDVEAGAALFAEGMAELGIEKVAAAE